jgi:protein-disulfide isomerase
MVETVINEQEVKKEDIKETKDEKELNKKKNGFTIVLVLMVLVLLVINIMHVGCPVSAGTTGSVTANAAAAKAMNVIKNNLLTSSDTISLNGVTSANGLYQVNIMLNGVARNVYVSNDGTYLFTSFIDLNNPPAAQVPTPTTLDISPGDAPTEGNLSAKVTIVELSDFQCPYCGKFYTDTYSQIKKDYIDTGKVKLSFINFPLVSIHSYSEKAAEASLCANDQGKFFQMHNKMFENQNALTVDDLKGYAKSLGMNATNFNTCLDAGKYKAKIQAGIDAATAKGVTGTPTFSVNGQMLVGALPYSEFKAVIDAELAK